MRASIAAEAAGVPSVSVVCEGFVKQAAATGRGHGFDGLPLAVLPGHVDAQSSEVMLANVRDVAVGQVIAGLTELVAVGDAQARIRRGFHQQERSRQDQLCRDGGGIGRIGIDDIETATLRAGIEQAARASCCGPRSRPSYAAARICCLCPGDSSRNEKGLRTQGGGGWKRGGRGAWAQVHTSQLLGDDFHVRDWVDAVLHCTRVPAQPRPARAAPPRAAEGVPSPHLAQQVPGGGEESAGPHRG